MFFAYYSHNPNSSKDHSVFKNRLYVTASNEERFFDVSLLQIS